MASYEQGRNGQEQGAFTEREFAYNLDRHGFYLADAKQKCSYQDAVASLKYACNGLFGQYQGAYMRQVELTRVSVWGGPAYEDYLLCRAGWESPIGIAVKKQDSEGTARDKLYRTITDMVRYYNCPCFLLLVGEKLESNEVYLAMVEEKQRSNGKILDVWRGMKDFITWCVEGFPIPDAAPSTFF